MAPTRKGRWLEPDADRLTGKQLIRVSVEGRPRTRTCVKLSPLSLPCCPFWLDVPALGRRLALTPRRYRQTPVMHRHREPAHTGVHRGRSHRKPRDLDSRLQGHRLPLHNTRINMEKARALWTRMGPTHTQGSQARTNTIRHHRRTLMGRSCGPGPNINKRRPLVVSCRVAWLGCRGGGGGGGAAKRHGGDEREISGNGR